MITPALVRRVFSAASMERWNDHPHPSSFTELGKQAHKMMIAWVIAMSDDTEQNIDLDVLIEGELFEFLHRVVVTDIRPPVFHQLMRNEKDRRRLNDWVFAQLEYDLRQLNGGFLDRFRNYISDPELYPDERKVLRAAHYLATHWEFGFIKNWSGDMYGVEKTEEEIRSQVWSHSDVPVVQRILDAPRVGIGAFVSLAGQLAFQKRWAQTPRVPQSSVLGHLFFVAAMTWFLSLEVGCGRVRRHNNFFAGLFHDLPEILTRDIISPIKRSVEGLDELISEYEKDSLNRQILPLLTKKMGADIVYYVQNEFKNKTRADGKIVIRDGEPDAEFDLDASDAVDGSIVEICDKLGAYIEAAESIRNGIASPQLIEGKQSLYNRCHKKEIYGYNIGGLFEE